MAYFVSSSGSGIQSQLGRPAPAPSVVQIQSQAQSAQAQSAQAQGAQMQSVPMVTSGMPGMTITSMLLPAIGLNVTDAAVESIKKLEQVEREVAAEKAEESLRLMEKQMEMEYAAMVRMRKLEVDTYREMRKIDLEVREREHELILQGNDRAKEKDFEILKQTRDNQLEYVNGLKKIKSELADEWFQKNHSVS